MKTVVVIIDFDNYFGNDLTKLNSEMMEFCFKEIVKLCEVEFTNFTTIEIRLYGGWYQEATFTKFASNIQQLLRDVSVFPKVSNNNIINGKIELATTLHIIPEFVWLHSYKETDGVKRIRIDHECVDTMCVENRDTCPKFILYKFTRDKSKKCHIGGCENLHKNVFKGAEQKMVDTLIACDVISLVEDDSVVGIIVISDDQDHLPSLALASIKKKENIQSIILGIQNEHVMEFISKFMSSFNIKTLLVA